MLIIFTFFRTCVSFVTNGFHFKNSCPQTSFQRHTQDRTQNLKLCEAKLVRLSYTRSDFQNTTSSTPQTLY